MAIKPLVCTREGLAKFGASRIEIAVDQGQKEIKIATRYVGNRPVEFDIEPCHSYNFRIRVVMLSGETLTNDDFSPAVYRGATGNVAYVLRTRKEAFTQVLGELEAMAPAKAG